jgi:hypothetical protein
MFEVFDCITGKTVAYVLTKGEAIEKANARGGATDYSLANEGYYIEAHQYNKPPHIIPIRFVEKKAATNARDMFNMGSDTTTYLLRSVLCL